MNLPGRKIISCKKIQLLLFAIIVCFVSSKLNGQNSKSTFRIVGYYPFNQAMNADTSCVPYKKLTHIDLAFVNPDSLGNFYQNFEALVPFINAAHSYGVKVLYSIGGGAYQNQYHALLKEDKRSMLIKNLVLNVLQYNADGIDVDLEAGYAFGTETDPNYGSFVIELADALRSKNKLITCALPGFPGKVVTYKVLEQFDFINIMSYDHTGPWSPDHPGNHSSYDAAVNDLNNYLNVLNVPAQKLVLGVPFYGHGFGPALNSPVIGWMTFKEIVSTYEGAELADQWQLPNKYTMYYNGISTIKNKTRLAKEKASGIMIWQLLYDTSQEQKSLLDAIYKASQ